MIRFEVVALLVRILAAVCILSVMACSQQRPAPVAQTDAEGLAGQGYVVRPGDTLSIIAERYGTTVDEIVSANRISDPDRVRAGSRIVVPNRKPVEKVKVPKQGRVVTQSVPQEPKAQKIQEQKNQGNEQQDAERDPAASELASPPEGEEEPRKRPNDVIVAPAEPAQKSESDDEKASPNLAPNAGQIAPQSGMAQAPSATQAPQFASLGFNWPVEGRLLNKFGPGGGGDGIDIAVAEGTPVKAALGGDVIYAGNSLSGYGNLVLLRHEDGLVTAYAYNQELLVKKGVRVLQGEVIANSGKTGAAREAALHFEVRRGTQPVDPLSFLPPR